MLKASLQIDIFRNRRFRCRCRLTKVATTRYARVARLEDSGFRRSLIELLQKLMSSAAYLLLLLTIAQAAPAVALSKIYEFNFRPQQTVYMHSGTKATIRLLSIPSDIDFLQVSLGRRKNTPRAHLIGKKLIDVKKTANQGVLDINIEIEETKDITEARHPIELKFKSLKEIDGKYTVTDHFSNFIRLIICPTNEQPVCGVVQVPCRSKLRCGESVEEVRQTFKNLCEMEKNGGRILNYGSCD